MNPHAAGVSNGVSRHRHPLNPLNQPAKGRPNPLNPRAKGASIIKNIYKYYKIKLNISHSFLCPRRKQKG